MRPIAVFNHGWSRAEHLLKLAELLTNTRERKMRNDWADDFKKFMHWNKGEQIDRVDGKGAILILRQSSEVDAKTFGEEYTSELLRAAHVTIVAALDRYCHELISSRCIKSLTGKKANSSELRKLAIPIQDVHEAIKHARKPNTRPLNLIKVSVQELLYKRTFQSPDEVSQGLSIIGITGIWTSCAGHLACEPKDVTKRLNSIVSRRNKIVHEGDLIRHRRGGRVRHAEITTARVASDVIWLAKLVEAIETAI
jgi:hypothetical protein